MTPIVRFLTAKDEWITERSDITTIPGLFKKGDKLKIVYLPENPKTFHIKDRRSSFVPYALIIVGIMFIIVGILKIYSSSKGI